eukprot:9476866-Pyramimonas_sp.AAC.1
MRKRSAWPMRSNRNLRCGHCKKRAGQSESNAKRHPAGLPSRAVAYSARRGGGSPRAGARRA